MLQGYAGFLCWPETDFFPACYSCMAQPTAIIAE
jgi:hypothetical protein